MLFILDSLESL